MSGFRNLTADHFGAVARVRDIIINRFSFNNLDERFDDEFIASDLTLLSHFIDTRQQGFSTDNAAPYVSTSQRIW